MLKRVLITGGAGFVGSHVADELLHRGYEVRVFDNFSPQVHGDQEDIPAYLNPEVEIIRGDLTDRSKVRKAVQGIDAVFHLAAAVGVGQSMYEIQKYVSANNLGTAVLLETLIEQPVQKIVVASSMSLYGEGLYKNRRGEVVPAKDRSLAQLKARRWEVLDEDGEELIPVPTPETKSPALASIYALSKYDQERMCLMIGKAYGMSATALRFFNIYGPRQSLSNPYTGVLAIFASRLLNDLPPVIFEDGGQQRDFVSVYDVAQACRLALETPESDGEVFNIGSGRQFTILELAESMAEVLGKDIEPSISEKYRVGDIRHCFADIAKAAHVLGYKPKITFEKGLQDLVEWLQEQQPAVAINDAEVELRARGLTV